MMFYKKVLKVIRKLYEVEFENKSLKSIKMLRFNKMQQFVVVKRM
jgi:hypothetical protein